MTIDLFEISKKRNRWPGCGNLFDGKPYKGLTSEWVNANQVIWFILNTTTVMIDCDCDVALFGNSISQLLMIVLYIGVHIVWTEVAVDRPTRCECSSNCVTKALLELKNSATLVGWINWRLLVAFIILFELCYSILLWNKISSLSNQNLLCVQKP